MQQTPPDPQPGPRSVPRRPRRRRGVALLLLASLALASCAAPQISSSDTSEQSWDQIRAEARGETVSLWMYGGDEQGNAYVDDVLAPAAEKLGVTLKRVPVSDTKDALNRVLAERQAGRSDGSVDLVWVNGENFRTGQQAHAWLCGWTSELPNMRYIRPDDPLLSEDFGNDVDGCESPWHKAQFSLVYDQAEVADPPHTLAGVLDWAEAHPGRFTYPAPPDFTGSVFVREVLYSVSGGYRQVPDHYSKAAYDELTPKLWRRLREVAPSLWRQGRTYPRDSSALERLYSQGQVDMTMTYGPATLTGLVEKGTYPDTTRVLPLEEGTVGNASFLAIPATSGDQTAAKVVANLALSPQQQLAKARPSGWGQFTVLDLSRLPDGVRRGFRDLPQSPVVPPYSVLSRHAQPELAADWVDPLDEGWRKHVLAPVRQSGS